MFGRQQTLDGRRAPSVSIALRRRLSCSEYNNVHLVHRCWNGRLGRHRDLAPTSHFVPHSGVVLFASDYGPCFGRESQYKSKTGTFEGPAAIKPNDSNWNASTPQKQRGPGNQMSTSTSLRRRPHCHKCGSPMQGHRRKNGTLVCPEGMVTLTETASSACKSHSTPLPSPPASPGGSPRASPAPPGFLPAREKPVFKPPPGARWHWRNPNWVSPPRKTRLHTPSDGERGSLTPTEPVTEPLASQRGAHLSPNFVREGEEEEENASALGSQNGGDDVQNWEVFEYSHHSNSLSPRPWSPFSQSPVTDISLNTVLRASTPLFKVFRTPREDLDDVRRTAQHEGKHVAVISAPLAHRATARVPSDRADGTVWVVVSDSVEDLKYAIDSQQGGMPGTFFLDGPPTRGVEFFQVMIAGLIGGLTVAAGLAYL